MCSGVEKSAETKCKKCLGYLPRDCSQEADDDKPQCEDMNEDGKKQFKKNKCNKKYSIEYPKECSDLKKKDKKRCKKCAEKYLSKDCSKEKKEKKRKKCIKKYQECAEKLQEYGVK